jgi:hypothetical protein
LDKEDIKKKENEKVEVSIPTLSEALEAIKIINHFYKAVEGNSKILSQIIDTEQHLQNQYWAHHSRQKKIRDFFI